VWQGTNNGDPRAGSRDTQARSSRDGAGSSARSSPKEKKKLSPESTDTHVWLRLIRPIGRPSVVPSGVLATNLPTRGQTCTFLSTHGVDGKVLDLTLQADGIQSRMMAKQKVQERDSDEEGETAPPRHVDHRRRYRMHCTKLRVFQKTKDKYVKTSTEGTVGYLNPRYGVAQIVCQAETQ
jgi:hypothetical protein